jgi:hypothetical protein
MTLKDNIARQMTLPISDSKLDKTSDSPLDWSIEISTFKHALILSIGLLLIGTSLAAIALLIWALLRFGEKPPNIANLCTDRNLVQGFVGNSDYYGLGIRLGLYIQWMTQIIANVIMPGERRSAAAAGMVFFAALMVAMFLSIFKHQCTYTVEIILIQLIFWPGLFIISIPFSISAATRKHYLGLVGAMGCLFYPMLIVSIWFWIRYATVGEQDFTPTPGGTTLFLFTKISGPATHPASLALAVMWVWVGAIVLMGTFFPERIINRLGRKAKVAVYIASVVSPYGAFFVAWLIVTTIFGFLITFISALKPDSPYWQKWSAWLGSKDQTSFPIQEEFVFM